MQKIALVCLFLILAAGALDAATKPHVVTFGAWHIVKWFSPSSEDRAVELKVRAILVDGKVKEYTTGAAHDVTERVFVVQRVFRVNDALPGENSNVPQWRWERGGWMSVDRVSGRVSQISLPLLDPFHSVVSWYRDHVAYCGVSDDRNKIYAMVIQLGRRKPLLRKYLKVAELSETPGLACPAPRWERKPARVSFEVASADGLIYTLETRALQLTEESEPQESPD